MTTLVSGRTATYDAWNRLVKVNGAETTEDRYDMTYRYDAMNRRIRRMTTHLLNAQWYYDDYYSGQQVIETRNEVATDRQYVWSPRYIDAPILRDQYLSSSSGDETLLPSDRIYYLGDANYNVTGLLYYNPNAAVWNVAERYAYTPYGQVQYRDSDWIEYEVQESIYSNTTLYTGRTLDPITGLYDYRARHYDPALERFINRDPIGYEDGMNLYEYVGDNPLTHIDPSGLLRICCRNVKDHILGSWIRHCDLRRSPCDKDTKTEWSEEYSVWQSTAPSRTLDDGTKCGIPCNQVTAVDIAACMARHPASPGPYPGATGVPGNNCQAATSQTIGRCCLNTTWRPNWYAGDPSYPRTSNAISPTRGKCLKGHYIVVIPVVIWVCDQWELPDWVDDSSKHPEVPDPQPYWPGVDKPYYM